MGEAGAAEGDYYLVSGCEEDVSAVYVCNTGWTIYWDSNTFGCGYYGNWVCSGSGWPYKLVKTHDCARNPTEWYGDAFAGEEGFGSISFIPFSNNQRRIVIAEDDIQ